MKERAGGAEMRAGRRGAAGVPSELVRRHTPMGRLRIHSVHAGHGEPVVLVHGLSGSHRWWGTTIPALAPHRSVHVPELVGFGGSRPAGAQPDLDGLAAVLTDWLDAIGVERADIVGHSMGGQVAIHLAASAPERVRRLVLADASGIPRPLRPSEVVRFAAEVLAPRSWVSPRFLPTIARDALAAGPRTLLRATLHILRDDVRPLLPRILAPTLLIWGALDPLTPPEQGAEMAASVPRSVLVTLPEASHVPMVEATASFNAALLGFLLAP